MAALLASGGAARPSAWNQLPGQGIAILRGTYDSGVQSFDKKGRMVRTDHFEKWEGSTTIEYGLTGWLELVLKPDLVSTSLGRHAHYTGLGTSAFGAQVQLATLGPAVFALQGTLQLPATTRQANLALIGNTSRNADGRALLGVGFDLGPWPSFLNAEAGYRIRGAHAPDEIHVDLTLGTRPLPRVMLLVQSFTTVPVGPGVPFFPRSTYSNAKVAGVYDLTLHWAAELGVFTTLYGRNALRERGVDLSLWYRF